MFSNEELAEKLAEYSVAIHDVSCVRCWLVLFGCGSVPKKEICSIIMRESARKTKRVRQRFQRSAKHN